MSQTTSIGYWHDVCVEHFKKLCEALEKSDQIYEQQIPLSLVLDEYGRFNVWAGNIGAHQVGRVSLDYRLREASHIKDQVISLLQYLSEILKDAISIVNGTRRPYEEASSSSESDSSDEDKGSGGAVSSHNDSETELQQLTPSIVKLIANLFKISIIIRKGNISQDRLLRSSKIDVSYYEPYDVQHAKNKFPSANDTLIDRLGKAISLRRQYLKYREQHHEKLANPTQSSAVFTRPDKDSRPLREDDSKAISGARTDQKPTKSDPSAKASVSFGASTSASTFIVSNTKGLINVDVDVYSESGTVSSYQPSVAGDEKLQLPPLPRESESGRDFECPYCYTICKLTGTTEEARQREWKRHMFKDLQPYMCTFAECTRADKMFERRTDWFRHETQLHRKEWSCNVPGHNAFQNKNDFAKHMEEEHGESFTQAQLPSVLALCERPLETTPSSCTLCHSKDAKDLTPRRLAKHLARHLETLALYALPRNNENGGNKSVASDLAAEASTTTASSSFSRPGSKAAETESVGSGVSSSDVNRADFYYDSPFDAIIRNFCNVEDSRDTRVPASWAWQLQELLTKEIQERGLQERGLQHQALIKRAAELLRGRGTVDLKVADLVMLIYNETMEEWIRLDSHEKAHFSPKETVFLVIQCMVTTFGSIDNLRTRLEDLEKDLRTALESEDEEDGASDISWDYVKPKVSMADSTIVLLSQAIAAIHLIISTSADEVRSPSGWKAAIAGDIVNFFQTLVANLETLVASTKGIRLDQGIVSQVEKVCWSQEQQIVEISAICQKEESLRYIISESYLVLFFNMFSEKVCGLLSLLGFDQQAGAHSLLRDENLERTNIPADDELKERRDETFTTLSDLLPPLTMISLVDSADPALVQKLLGHIPTDLLLLGQKMFSVSSTSEDAKSAVDTLTLIQKKDLLRKILRSPQISQKLKAMDSALQNGYVPEALESYFDTGGSIVPTKRSLKGGGAVEAFLYRVRWSVQRNGEDSGVDTSGSYDGNFRAADLAREPHDEGARSRESPRRKEVEADEVFVAGGSREKEKSQEREFVEGSQGSEDPQKPDSKSPDPDIPEPYKPKSRADTNPKPLGERPRKYADKKKLRKKNLQGIPEYDVSVVEARYDDVRRSWMYTLKDWRDEPIVGETEETKLV